METNHEVVLMLQQQNYHVQSSLICTSIERRIGDMEVERSGVEKTRRGVENLEVMYEYATISDQIKYE